MMFINSKDVHHCKGLRLKDFRDHYGLSRVKSGLQSIIDKAHPRNCYEFLFLQIFVTSHRTWVTEKVFCSRRALQARQVCTSKRGITV